MSSENGESIQILHYENGQKYEPHFDFFHDVANQQMGGHRIATVLMYLSNVEKGGETIFPNSEVKSSIVFFGQKKKRVLLFQSSYGRLLLINASTPSKLKKKKKIGMLIYLPFVGKVVAAQGW